jgi:hypothetical protein
VRRSTLLVDPDSIVESDTELIAELEQGWRKDDETDGLVEKLSREAKRQIEGNDLPISPRVFSSSIIYSGVSGLARALRNLQKSECGFRGFALLRYLARVVWSDLNNAWTQDRIIVAQAVNHLAPLITRDELIRQN